MLKKQLKNEDLTKCNKKSNTIKEPHLIKNENLSFLINSRGSNLLLIINCEKQNVDFETKISL
jgi:hypothetical protein